MLSAQCLKESNVAGFGDEQNDIQDEMTETFQRIVEINAESESQAIAEIRAAYKDEWIVLGAEDHIKTKISLFIE